MTPDNPDGGLVAASTGGGQVLLFDSAKGELIESLHGHLNSVGGVAFSKDGRRLISTSGVREAVKVLPVLRMRAGHFRAPALHSE